MRLAVTAVGIALLLCGLLFVGQGLGIIDWPQSSFMIDQQPWVWRGAAIAAAGLVLLLAARRR